MERYIDLLLERSDIVKNWKAHLAEISEAAEKALPGSRVYVFGSVAKGESTGGSDVDVLVVSDKTPRDSVGRAKVRARIERLSKLPLHHPFELHLADLDEAEWYFKNIKELTRFR